MARPKTASEPIRKLTKTGGSSYYVTIPLDYIREFGWREGQKLVVKKRGSKITIEDWEA
jgi:bifunctional DNA-binding transcriptional regulator/antitoxin component of YhaV-PrlF toxin-antitoxin module